MRKRGVAVIVAAMMVWAMALPAVAAVNPFSDVRADHWAYDAIVTLAGAGLIEGYPDGTFGGDRTFTRYEMAQVFARILARFESLIDQRIAEGIDAKADRLAQEIQATRRALEAKINENYDELLQKLAELEGRVDTRLGNLEARVDELEVVGVLAPEVREVLAEQASSDIIARLNALREDLDDLARRVLRLEGSTPSRSEAAAIAEKVVADALAELAGDVAVAREAAADEFGATARLLEGRVNDLSDAILRLTDEFRAELENLGVRVSDLEARMGRQEARLDQLAAEVDLNRMRIARNEAVLEDHGGEIRSLWERFGNVSLSGKNVTSFDHTFVDSTDKGNSGWEDPRDHDSKQYEDKDLFQNKLVLELTATPAENVNVKAELALISQLFGDKTEGAVEPKLNLDVTTPGVVRLIHLGDLDKTVISSPFDKYTLHEKKAEDHLKAGGNFNLVWGQADSTSLNGFVSRLGLNEYALGSAVAYSLSDAFDIRVRGVRNTGQDDTVVSFASEGDLDHIAYHVMSASHVNDGAKSHATVAGAVIPVGSLLVTGEYGVVEAGFNPLYGKELKSFDPDAGPDWVDREFNPQEDWLQQGESEHSLSAAVPVLGAATVVSAGRRDDLAGQNQYTQARLVGVGFEGFEVGVLVDRREDEHAHLDQTVQFSVDANLLGADVTAYVHQRTNDQEWAVDGRNEAEQKVTWVTGSTDIQFILPLTLEGRFGVSQTAAADQSPHSFLGVSLKEYPVGPLTVSAGYSTARNVVDTKHWWQNKAWSSTDENQITFGLGYTFLQMFGTDVKTSYEHKLVYRDGALYGTARNTFKASFEKQLRGGEATLKGEGKYVVGGTPDEKGNDRDLTAKLGLTYPVFAGGNLTLGGVYVSSQGSKPGAVPYTVYHIDAGLEITF